MIKLDDRIGFPGQLAYKERIKPLGLKKETIAEKIGISNCTLSNYINGHNWMNLEMHKKLDSFLSKMEVFIEKNKTVIKRK